MPRYTCTLNIKLNSIHGIWKVFRLLHFRHGVFHLKMYFNIIMDFPQLSTHTTIILQYMKSGVLSAL